MIDAVTVTLIILTAALLRWSLLIDSDAAPGVREDEGFIGNKGFAPVKVRAASPHTARIRRPHNEP